MRVERDQIKTLLVLAGLGAAFGLGVWLPLHVKRSRAEQQIAVTQRQLGFDRASVQNLGVLNQEVAQLRQIVSASGKEVPQDGDQAELLRQITTELSRQKVTDQEVQSQPIVVGAEYCVAPLSLRFKGRFPAVHGLLRELESLRRMVRVTRLEVDREPTLQGDLLTVRMEVCAFFAGGEGKKP